MSSSRRSRSRRMGSKRGPQGGGADRRPRYGDARRGRRRARGDREPRREFLRRRGGADLLDGCRRPAAARRLQGDQHRRQHDRPPHRAPSAISAGRRRGSTISSICRPRGLSALLIVGRRHVTPGASAASALGAVLARRLASPLAQCRLAGSGDGRRARPRARRAPRYYGGKLVEDAWMGDGRTRAEAADIRAALTLYRRADMAPDRAWWRCSRRSSR